MSALSPNPTYLSLSRESNLSDHINAAVYSVMKVL